MDEKFAKKLTDEQRRVLYDKGTERPFTGKLLHNKEKGVYVCAACGSELFSSEAKFDSGTGWPSFFEAKEVDIKTDLSHFMVRKEVVCRKCGGHLGHLFNDGPAVVKRTDGALIEATGKRYCINSVALKFRK